MNLKSRGQSGSAGHALFIDYFCQVRTIDISSIILQVEKLAMIINISVALQPLYGAEGQARNGRGRKEADEFRASGSLGMLW
jgi:hypothetical protein